MDQNDGGRYACAWWATYHLTGASYLQTQRWLQVRHVVLLSLTTNSLVYVFRGVLENRPWHIARYFAGSSKDTLFISPFIPFTGTSCQILEYELKFSTTTSQISCNKSQSTEAHHSRKTIIKFQSRGNIDKSFRWCLPSIRSIVFIDCPQSFKIGVKQRSWSTRSGHHFWYY